MADGRSGNLRIRCAVGGIFRLSRSTWRVNRSGRGIDSTSASRPQGSIVEMGSLGGVYSRNTSAFSDPPAFSLQNCLLDAEVDGRSRCGYFCKDGPSTLHIERTDTFLRPQPSSQYGRAVQPSRRNFTNRHHQQAAKSAEFLVESAFGNRTHL